MKNSLTLLLGILIVSQGYTQSAALWSNKAETDMDLSGGRRYTPTRYRTMEMNATSMHLLLFSAPAEAETPPSQSNVILTLPTPDGETDSFRIVSYVMMEPELSARFPEIRTFRGIDIHDPFKTVRCDWTVRGFSAIVSSRAGRYFVEPAARKNLIDFTIFYKSDHPRPSTPFECGYEDDDIREQEHQTSRVSGDCVFRSYRLAVAATGEYSNYFDANGPGDVATVLSEVVIAVNRVNEVYEHDVTVRLILIANTTAVFYYDPATDPFSGSACTQLGQNQTNMTNVIGGSNYDIGHVFSTGSGGCASAGVCSSTNKARGATGVTPPEGDLFYIDYVAHEMGHQFSASHTFNNSCNGNISTANAYEPGSGSTIMAYAGICNPNVQNNSDDYFHGRSVEQINNYISSGTGNSCDLPIPFVNSPPVITPGADYTIPRSTPFMLTAVATDADGDPMTYCWEQWDPESGSMPPSATNTAGPMFRSLDPDPSPTRYFPKLSDLVNNNSPTWEVLPSVTRNMEFRVTVWDFHDGIAGCADEDNINVNTTSTSGPFVVTAPNTSSVDWVEGSAYTVTWNVAGTTGAPVSCANVDILLSKDGGFTYPYTLQTNTPNDGSQSVIVPYGTVTAQARVMVRASGNVFFDISNQNFDILQGPPTYTLMATPSEQTNCTPGTAIYTINVTSFYGYAFPVALSESGHPSGGSVSFSTNPVIPGNTSQMTITIPSNANPTNYTLTISGSSTGGPKSIQAILHVISPAGIPTLVSPTDGETDVTLDAILDWATVSNATSYDIELATDPLFNNMVFSGSTTMSQIQPLLYSPGTLYYWHVLAENVCGSSSWSATRSFETRNCVTKYSTDVPKIISASGTPTVTSALTISNAGEIEDVNVIDLIGTHTFLNDLIFKLTSPEGTQVILIDQWCGSQNNFNINLDDQAAPGAPPCPYNNGGTYQPEEMLSAFNGENAMGTWTLTVMDVANTDGGSLNSWALDICLTNGCSLVVTSTADSGTGSLRDAIDCASPGQTVSFANGLNGSTILLTSPLIISKDLTVSGAGQNITISAMNTSRAFDILSGNVVFEVLNVIGGSSVVGGAIQNAGSVLIKELNIDVGPQPNSVLVQNNGTLTLTGACHIAQ